MKRDGSSFTDHDIHRIYAKQGFANPEGEWFNCTLNDLRKAIWEIKQERERRLIEHYHSV
jgi:hypothetical protein